MTAEVRRGFASDNWAGVHPAVLRAIGEANAGHVPAYGDDPYTAAAVEALRRHLGENARPFLVFNGTGANVTGLSAVLKRHEAIICAESAHINLDECGAPERFTGGKLLTVATPDSKLTPELASARLWGVGIEHHSQPRVVSVSQVSEFGTVYTAEELRALATFAHEHGLLLHMDGARLCNAAASLGCTLRDITADVGVDVLSFGGTKNGLLGAEAVVFFDEGRARDFAFVRKQSAQLASKMRFVAAQLTAMLEGDLWLTCARNANEMAARLAEGLRSLGVTLTQEPQANELFAVLPAEVVPALEAAYPFYVWDEERTEVRLVCSWDTTDGDVDGFVAELDGLLQK